MPIGTIFQAEEPIGFGQAPFGDHDSSDKEFVRGFGEEVTLFAEGESSKGTTTTTTDEGSGTAVSDTDESSGTTVTDTDEGTGTTHNDYTDD